MSQTDETRIALLTDTHAWPDAPGAFGGEQEQLQPAFETIHATFLADVRSQSPEILIHLGDFTCGGGSFEMPQPAFYAALQRLNRELRAAGRAPILWAARQPRLPCRLQRLQFLRRAAGVGSPPGANG